MSDEVDLRVYPDDNCHIFWTDENKTSMYGPCGEDLTFYLDLNALTLNITGTGESWGNNYIPSVNYTSSKGYTSADYGFLYNVRTSYWNSYGATVTVEGATIIHSLFFSYNTRAESYTFDDKLTQIDEYVFDGNSNLKTIDLSDTALTTLGQYSFNNCQSLESYVLPKTVTTIGNYAFQNCRSLNNVVIPKNWYNWGIGVYSGCTSLTDVEFEPFTEEEIEQGLAYTTLPQITFANTGLTNIDFMPSHITTFSYALFSGCPLKTAIIKKGVTTLEDVCLGNISTKCYIEIPKTVTTISKQSDEDYTYGAFGYYSEPSEETEYFLTIRIKQPKGNLKNAPWGAIKDHYIILWDEGIQFFKLVEENGEKVVKRMRFFKLILNENGEKEVREMIFHNKIS